MCESFNREMLKRIDGEEIELHAEDSVQTENQKLREKAFKYLNQQDEDVSKTAGFAKTINIKIGARIMLRRNIDASIGLINGAIGEVVAVQKNENGKIEKIDVRFGNTIHQIERVSVNFEIFQGLYMTRKQFPITLSYAITAHKSQGISLKTAIIDAGSLNFAYGQIYVALSRLTFLEGLHLINLDPHRIKADPRPIAEYNRLRAKFRPDLPQFEMIPFPDIPKRPDQRWMIPKRFLNVQTKGSVEVENVPLDIIGLSNQTDKNIDFMNATMQILLHNNRVRKEILALPRNNFLKNCLNGYMDKTLKGLAVFPEIQQFLAESQNVSIIKFLNFISRQNPTISKCFHCIVSTIYHCPTCKKSVVFESNEDILTLNIDSHSDDRIFTLNEIFDANFNGRNIITRYCTVCEQNSEMIEQKFLRANGQIIFFRIFHVGKNETLKDEINPNHPQTKEKHIRVKSVPSFKITINGFPFEVGGVIMKEVQKLNTSYSCLVKGIDKKWTFLRDLLIRIQCFPRNSKNVDIFILQQKL